MNRLALVGMVLLAAGLVALAFYDPVIRTLAFGASTSSTAGAFNRTAFAGGAPFNSTALGGKAASGSTSSIVTLVAYGVAVVGFVLTVTGLFVISRRKSDDKISDAADEKEERVA